MEAQMPTRPPPPPSQSSHQALYTKLKQKHDEAFLYIEQGLCCDESGQAEQAVQLYRKGLKVMDEALDASKSMIKANYDASTWTKIIGKVNKMNQTKTQMSSRIQCILSSDQSAAAAIRNPPPSYEEASSLTHMEHNSLLEDDLPPGINAANAHIVFAIDGGVQVFFMSKEGGVSAPTYPSRLGIFILDEEQQTRSGDNVPPAFLKVGNWTYPLLPGCSPVLRADWGAYIFPDTANEGGSVGVIIPDNISAEDRSVLEDLFENLTEFRKQVPIEQREQQMDQDIMPGSERTSTMISKGLITGAEWVARGMKKGAEQGTKLIEKGSQQIKSRISPDEEKQIDPKLQRGVEITRDAAGVAVKVSGVVVDAIGQAAMALGRELTPVVKQASDKYLPESWTKAKDGKTSKVEDVVEVAAGGLQGFGTVFLGLEEAAMILGKSVKKESTLLAEYKYGPQASKLTGNTMDAAGGLVFTAYNIKNLGVRRIVKNTAKNAARGALLEMDREAQSKEEMDNTANERGVNPAPPRPANVPSTSKTAPPRPKLPKK